MRLLTCLCLILTLSACADRGVLEILPAPDGAETRDVLVATTRAEDKPNRFGVERRDSPLYLRAVVSVPPDRDPGALPVRYGRTDPARDFALVARDDLQGPDAFERTLRQTGKAGAVLFIHGYNTAFSDGVFRTAQIAHDFDLSAAAVHFSWPSAAAPLGYAHDRDTIFAARDALEQVLRRAARATRGEVLPVAHSMGALLLMDTLRQIELTDPGWVRANLSGVVLMAPDVSVDLFLAQAARFQAYPKLFAIFVSDRDRALQLAQRLNGQRTRLGQLRDPAPLSHLPVTLVDVSDFDDDGPIGHLTAVQSPALISLLGQPRLLAGALARDPAQPGFLPGTILTVQNASRVALSPGRAGGF